MWVAEHGWVYRHAIIDCCTREICAWALDVRCRADEAMSVIDQAVADRGIQASTLTLGTDNGTAFTSRRFRARLGQHGITHRRGGYRDPESQAFIESWFGKLNSAASGAKSSRPSTKPERRSPPTSRAITTGRTAA